MRVILIHGRDQQGKSSDSLLEIWKEALDVGLSEAGLGSLRDHDFRLPFYGDRLVEIVEQIRLATPNGVTTKGEAPALTHMEAFQVALLQELIPEEQLLSSPTAPVEKGFQNTVVAHLLAKVADGSPWSKDFLALFTEDVSVYLNNGFASAQINDIVRREIPSEPCVVVGHSLGSVVAYRVLQEMGNSANVVRFITLGSPLGLNAIRNVLRPLSVPKCVRSWLNVYDSRDIVSLHPLDKARWDVIPNIENVALDKNHMSNRHGISGYLDYPEVARAISQALVGDSSNERSAQR